MNFLVQGSGGLPAFDFGFALLHAVEHQRVMQDISREVEIHDSGFQMRDDSHGWCPVGSVEFVHDYFCANDILVPKPLNIPRPLWRLSGLEPVIVTGPDTIPEMFLKSTDIIKHPHNGPSKIVPNGSWQATDVIDAGFASEWRILVRRGQVVGAACYAGDPFHPPQWAYVLNAINNYAGAPPVYTLDVALGPNNPEGNSSHYIVECHHFYACGMYGISIPHTYPQMLAQWYSWWILGGCYDAQEVEK